MCRLIGFESQYMSGRDVGYKPDEGVSLLFCAFSAKLVSDDVIATSANVSFPPAHLNDVFC